MQIRKTLTGCVIVIIAFLLLFFHFRGLSIHDGGYILHSAQNILRGQTIYKDFDFVYTPGSIFLALLSFKLFGESVLAERITALIISLLTCFLIYKISTLLTKKNYLALIPILTYLFWGPVHINFLSPVMLSLSSSLLGLFFLIQAAEKNNKRYLFYAGLVGGIIFLFKQNFGAMFFLTGISVILLNKKLRSVDAGTKYSYGLLIPILIFLLYLIYTKSLNAYLYNVWFYTIQEIIIKKVLNTPFIYSGKLILVIAKTIFYTVPVWLSLFTSFLLFKSHRKLLFIPLWITLSYIVSIRPETDFIHLIPILSLTGILILFFIDSKLFFTKIVGFTSFITLAILGLYTALYMGYYRWEKPLAENTVYEKNSRVNIFVDRRWHTIIGKLNSYLDQNTKKDDYFFVDMNAPLLYFLTGRKNPTRFDFIVPYTEEKQYQDEMINDLKNKQVKVVLTENTYDKDSSLVMQYIRSHYLKRKSIDQFVLWKIRE